MKITKNQFLLLVCAGFVVLGFLLYSEKKVPPPTSVAEPTQETVSPQRGYTFPQLHEALRQCKHLDQEAMTYRAAAQEIIANSQIKEISELRSLIDLDWFLTQTELEQRNGMITSTEENMYIQPGGARLLVQLPPDSLLAQFRGATGEESAFYRDDWHTLCFKSQPLSKFSKAVLMIHEGLHARDDIVQVMNNETRKALITQFRAELSANVFTYLALNEYSNGEYAKACEEIFSTGWWGQSLTPSQLSRLNRVFGPSWIDNPRDILVESSHRFHLGAYRVLQEQISLHEKYHLMTQMLIHNGYTTFAPGPSTQAAWTALEKIIRAERLYDALCQEPDQTQCWTTERTTPIINFLKEAIRLQPGYDGSWSLLSRVYANRYGYLTQQGSASATTEAQEIGQRLLASNQTWYRLRPDDSEAVEYYLRSLIVFNNHEEALRVLTEARTKFGQQTRLEELAPHIRH